MSGLAEPQLENSPLRAQAGVFVAPAGTQPHEAGWKQVGYAAGPVTIERADDHGDNFVEFCTQKITMVGIEANIGAAALRFLERVFYAPEWFRARAEVRRRKVNDMRAWTRKKGWNK